MSLNAIPENKILAKISEFTVLKDHGRAIVLICETASRSNT